MKKTVGCADSYAGRLLQKATWTSADVQSQKNDSIDVLSKQWRLKV